MSWRVMLNSSLWKQKKYEDDFACRPEVRRLAQSKGNCHMKHCPKKGDIVSFVLKGKIVMRGVIDGNGFEDGTAHQEHSCNDGVLRFHATTSQFIWIRIEEIGLSENIRPTGQRTWAKMPI